MHIEYRTLKLEDLRSAGHAVREGHERDEGAAASERNAAGDVVPDNDQSQNRAGRSPRPAVGTPREVLVQGEPATASRRFWRSLFGRFGLTGNVFRYFGCDEVLDRVAERNRDHTLRLCVQYGASGKPRLLAVSNPKRPLLTYDDADALIRGNGGEEVHLDDGVITSRHAPPSGERGFEIGPDRFHNRFVVETPIDGFGQPRIYLSLLRLVCENGAVGYSRAFRSDVRIGEDATYTLQRALGQFDHDEGYAALRQRFESAQHSWASLGEVIRLHKVLARVRGGGAYQDRLRDLSGRPSRIYGVANLESLSAKRLRVLPAPCRVYDLINLASEMATHKAAVEDRPRLQAYIGTLISDEFDLEGTADRVPEFRDLFVGNN